ncbi:hypothetical protein Aph01nite_60260 [Acrocarpospora phusangensis]|uniref:Uncharacterized protein n=1 Tax=Acrocarpospora phusangensis TaxID=1070424 RepID=A0A919QF52_9ACTN|nr:hypothetical protein Aph01nite_60260 [Acrocarpospora phusangensis]
MSFCTGLPADASGAEAVPETNRWGAACAGGTNAPDTRTATAASPPIRRPALLGNPTVFPSVDDDKDEQRLATPTDKFRAPNECNTHEGNAHSYKAEDEAKAPFRRVERAPLSGLGTLPESACQLPTPRHLHLLRLAHREPQQPEGR